MSKFTHSICEDCWNQRNPDRIAHRVTDVDPEACCFCAKAHSSGIYVRANPAETPCKGQHINRGGK